MVARKNAHSIGDLAAWIHEAATVVWFTGAGISTESGLPNEITGENGQPLSPRAHLHIHAVVERQLAADEPKGIRAIARELEQLGLSRHDVRHEIGAVIAEHMWYVTKEGCPFDEGRYLAGLRKIVESYR